ncbi:MAG: exodeoxyribonuclease III [Rhodospirillales bacterium RIFCSPLOWO2_01_FULL_65_14]|nr:MAG: exodeoxyribonuclease III [Rhodospirillales bacterium RIFCSPLOWO2_01_FULL_65_14]
MVVLQHVPVKRLPKEGKLVVKIATWNVNSVKARLPRVLEWLADAKPDVALLQEIKTTDDAFPGLEIGDLGYNVAVAGQKTYNGVAILSKTPIEVEMTALPGDDEDDQARYIEAVVGGAGKGVIRVASIYLPNGNPARDDNGKDSDKFRYKLAWMERLSARVREMLKTEDIFVLGGDYNVCPTDDDVHDPKAFADDALCRPESRARFRALMYLGLTDAFHALNPAPHQYSYWDYQGGAWQKGDGLRIDHLLLSPQAADRLKGSGIDKKPRGKEKTSDHTPVWCELEQ